MVPVPQQFAPPSIQVTGGMDNRFQQGSAPSDFLTGNFPQQQNWMQQQFQVVPSDPNYFQQGTPPNSFVTGNFPDNMNFMQPQFQAVPNTATWGAPEPYQFPGATFGQLDASYVPPWAEPAPLQQPPPVNQTASGGAGANLGGGSPPAQSDLSNFGAGGIGGQNYYYDPATGNTYVYDANWQYQSTLPGVPPPSTIDTGTAPPSGAPPSPIVRGGTEGPPGPATQPPVDLGNLPMQQLSQRPAAPPPPPGYVQNVPGPYQNNANFGMTGFGSQINPMYQTGSWQNILANNPGMTARQAQLQAGYAQNSALAFALGTASPGPGGTRAGMAFGGLEGASIQMPYNKMYAPLYASMMKGGSGASLDPTGHSVLRQAGGMNFHATSGTGAR